MTHDEADRSIRIPDDDWVVGGVTLVVAGFMFAGVGLLSHFDPGSGAAESAPTALGGLASACLGLVILRLRPGEILVDSSGGTLTRRGLLFAMSFSFAEVTLIEIERGHQLFWSEAPPPCQELFDVVLHSGTGESLIVYRDQELSTARYRADHLARLTQVHISDRSLSGTSESMG